MFKLIIIDDEPSYLEEVSNLFDWSLFNFELSGAFSSSEKALEHIKNNHVDAIITDIKMPEITGIEISKICYEKYPHIKLAFLTAYSDFEYAKNAIKYNVTDYILKTSTYLELSQSIEEFLLSFTNSELDLKETMDKFKKQQLFSNLLLGMISSKEMLKEQLKENGLSNLDIKNRCSVLTFALKDFNDYLKDWSYSREQLYTAIEQMFMHENRLFSFFNTSYAHDKVEFIAVCEKSDVDFNKILSEELETFKNNVKSILKLDIQKIKQQDFSSLEALIAENEIDLGINNEILNDILEKSQNYIKENYHKDISLTDIATHVALSPTYFSAYYKKMSNSNFNADLNKYRIEKAKELLTKTNVKASQVFHQVGYQSYSYFYKIFKDYTGVTPAVYQSKYKSPKG